MEKYLIKKTRRGEPSTKGSKVTQDDSEVNRGDDDGEEETEKELDHSKAKKKRQKEPSFSLKEVKGNLFAAPEKESLAHCISEDVRMGKGIAKIFKDKFGGVKDLLSQGVKPGGVAVLKRGSRYVYYMVTKEKFWNKPTYECLRCSLEAMAKHCQGHNVKALSMPRIGCGLDGLKWNVVKQILLETFKDMDLAVTIYTL